MRKPLIVLWMLCCSITAAFAQVSVGIGFNLPGLSIGINLPAYPQMALVPGYPVYYAPQMNSNYFFYDGMYWVYQGDNWYASSWYNGPWGLVEADAVPLFILRVPVRYYRQPPAYFRDWRGDAAPRWGEHWGNSWDGRHHGWDDWDRHAAPTPAPLPAYQRQYSGNRYPPAEQQHVLQDQNYRYQPHDAVVQQHYQRAQSAPAPAVQARPAEPRERIPATPDRRNASRQPAPVQTAAPALREEAPQRRGGDVQGQRATAQEPAPQGGSVAQRPNQNAQPTAAAHEQPQRAAARENQANQPQAQDRGRDKGDPREGERDNR
jgi:hypothetical protein